MGMQNQWEIFLSIALELIPKQWIRGVIGLLAILPHMSLAQSTNPQIYQQLLQQYLDDHPGPYRKISGQLLTNYFPPYTTDTTTARTLQVFSPELTYERLSKGIYRRNMHISINQKDSTTRSETVVFQDTLNRKQLRYVLKNSPDSLRGDNPTRWGKWVGPTTLIATSVAGIVSLFFLRSSND